MPAFQHNGRAIHFADEGPREGLPIVFSNSLGTDFRAWNPLLPHLPPGCRFIRYDKAGHGLSDFAGERPIEAHAEDLAALLDHLNIEKPVVVGLSVGGLIAQAFASAHPHRTSALVLCDTGHKIGTPEIWNPRIEAINAGGMNAVLEPTMERWFTARYRAEEVAFPIWCNMLTRTLPEGYCSVGRAIRDLDLPEGMRIGAIIHKGEVITPPVSDGSLDGITRQVIFDLCDELGISIREASMTRYDLYTADEAFLTGTAAETIPMVKLDQREIGDGKPGEPDILRAFLQPCDVRARAVFADRRHRVDRGLDGGDARHRRVQHLRGRDLDVRVVRLHEGIGVHRDGIFFVGPGEVVLGAAERHHDEEREGAGHRG